MRVITGKARGLKLKTLSGNDVRPTTDMVKEAIFSSLQNKIEGSKMLDLFCGSGQMGIEALSRGAYCCTFVDESRNSIAVTKENLKTTGLSDGNIKIVNSSAGDFLRRTTDCFDIVFMDPPYLKNLIQDILSDAVAHVNKNGVIICEHDKHDELPDTVNGFAVSKKYKYGRICLTVYRCEE